MSSTAVPLSFSPPQVWQRTRRTFGVVIVLAILAPMGILSHVLNRPEEAAKIHGLPLQLTLLLTAIILPLLAIWLVWLCFAGAERLRFEVVDGTLKIHTLMRSYAMPLHGVVAKRTPAKLSMRLAGTGLPGLYTGLYLLGDQRARAWATVREGGVVLEGEKRWFVTPADTDGFLAAVKAAGAHVQ